MRNWKRLGPGAMVAFAGLTVVSLQGCEEVADQCNLSCPSEGIVEGNASISGVAKVDAFFSAVVNFSGRANSIASAIDTQLGRIRTSLALDADANGAEIVAAIKTRYRLQGDLGIAYQPAQCAVSAQATLQAQARCEGKVNPGSATVTCSGACEVEAGVELECEGNAELKCVGTAPALNCTGSCQGTCELTAAAACTGTCRGTCDGDCSIVNADGSCAGQCEGTCEGTCELTAGGECTGQCKGECTYTAPTAGCEANARARCEGSANATVECSGRCEGEVTPPSVEAECQASAKAEASINVECTPPQLEVRYGFTGQANAQTRAEFEAFLVQFRASVSAIVAELERSKFVLDAGADLTATGIAAVEASVDATLEGDLSVKNAAGLACALDELDSVGGVVRGATTRLQGSVSAAGELTVALGGGQ